MEKQINTHDANLEAESQPTTGSSADRASDQGAGQRAESGSGHRGTTNAETGADNTDANNDINKDEVATEDQGQRESSLDDSPEAAAEDDESENASSKKGSADKNDSKHDHLYTCLGEVMRDRRKSLALSQEQLAAGSGIDRAFLSNLERGLRKPSFGTVARIAQGLKLKYSRLVARCEKCQEQRSKSA